MSPSWWILIALIICSPIALFFWFAGPHKAKQPTPASPASSNPIDGLKDIFSRYSDRISFYFLPLPVYANAFAALPPFLLVFSRYVLITNDLLERGNSKIDNALLSVTRGLSSPDDLLSFNSHLSYFQSFLTPGAPLPRCEFLFCDNSLLSGYPPKYPLILMCALGDSIVNPRLVKDASAAVVLPSEMSQGLNVLSVLKEQVTPALADFADALCAHFSRYKQYYRNT